MPSIVHPGAAVKTTSPKPQKPHPPGVNDCYFAALDYLKRGWSVLPLCPEKKHPTVEWKEFQTQLPTEGEVRVWWTNHPTANVGIALGAVSGLVGLDVDSADGHELLMKMSGGDLPDSLQFETSGGGYRLLYRLPDGHPSRTISYRDEDGHEALRILGTGSQTVMPPSVHPSGKRYGWVTLLGPGEIEAALAPPWLLQLLAKKADDLGGKPPPSYHTPPPPTNAVQRARGYLAKCDPAVSGQGGHNQTFKVACKVVRGFALDVDTAVSLLMEEWNPRCVPPWTEKELRHKCEEALAKGEGEIGYLLHDEHHTNPSGATKPDATGTADQPASEDIPAVAPAWPEAMKKEAFYGLVGEIVETLKPHSEADPVALLGQLLVGFGSAVGRTAHFVADGTEHYGNEFLLLIGPTAGGRKGVSWRRSERVLEGADADWVDHCIRPGLSSGEGLIYHIRDPIEGKTLDPGEEDKRLLALEEEFARILVVAARKGSTLGPILRNAWDGCRMGNLIKGKENSPSVSKPHVSIIAHCTQADLTQHLLKTDCLNGFGNRFLMVCVRRAQSLPDGGDPNPPGLAELKQQLNQALAHAKNRGVMVRDEEARQLWKNSYETLTTDRPGIAGALLARGAPHVMRLALLYALLDQDDRIRAPHLRAALAFWDYCRRSVRYVFGDALGDVTADTILAALKAAEKKGLSREQIRSDLFHRNKPTLEIDAALTLLLQGGLAHCRKEPAKTVDGTPGKGRHEERWYLGPKNASTP